MKSYKISIDPDALQDIQDATDWYNEQLLGLGARFQRQVRNQINSLKKNGSLYTVRYEGVRCMLISKFPYLVHFSIDKRKGRIEILAVFHTSRNPKIWSKRKESSDKKSE